MTETNLGVVSGNVLPLNLDGDSGFFSFVSSFQQELSDQLCCELTSRNLTPKVNGPIVAFRKDAVDHIPNGVVCDDEYISWCAQKHGYRVMYVPYARAYARDPMSMKDYLSSRRRILGGHFLIRKTLHYSVPTTRIDLLLPGFGKLAVKYWKKSLHIITMIFLECLCYPFAFHDAIKRKVSPFFRIESTKFCAK